MKKITIIRHITGSYDPDRCLIYKKTNFTCPNMWSLFTIKMLRFQFSITPWNRLNRCWWRIVNKVHQNLTIYPKYVGDRMTKFVTLMTYFFTNIVLFLYFISNLWQWCWSLYDDDNFMMLVTESLWRYFIIMLLTFSM